MGHVLVVDDDPNICELLDIVLSEEGYEVQRAMTLCRAFELVQVRPPDLILFDMSLTDGDGGHFVKQYRQLPNATARLIAVSGMPNLEEESARIETHGFLVKPFELEDLLSIVAKAISAARPAAV
jgi:DNA-binding response OmpR family regulator